MTRDTRSDSGQYYPDTRTGTPSEATMRDKVDRVNLGELEDGCTVGDVKDKVNRIVRAMATVATCLALCARAATAPLGQLRLTATVVTNEEDAAAMAAVGALGAALSNRVETAAEAARADMASGTNAVMRAMDAQRAAESNRVEATYAKRSEIPSMPDLSPYALKSEIPADYARQGDLTNLATRTWIEGQGFATGMEIEAVSNRMETAAEAARADMASGTNAIWTAHRTEVNALRTEVTDGTNALWTATTNAVAQAARPATPEKRIAMFILPFNNNGDGETSWMCLELKASTNNFRGESSERAAYYMHTSLRDMHEMDGALVYALGEAMAGEDTRSLQYIEDTMGAREESRMGNASSLVVLVRPENCRRKGGGWLAESNEEITWVWARGTMTGVEASATERTLWRPCAPVKWLTALPRWATGQ